MNISMSEPLKGPGRDHSSNTASGTCSSHYALHYTMYYWLFSGLHDYYCYMVLLFLLTGHFLYVTKPAEFGEDWAAFQSPHLEPTNSSHPCRVGSIITFGGDMLKSHLI